MVKKPIIIQYLTVAKYCLAEEDFQYIDCIEMAKKKFPDLCDQEDLLITDRENAIIDEDVFEYFFKQTTADTPKFFVKPKILEIVGMNSNFNNQGDLSLAGPSGLMPISNVAGANDIMNIVYSAFSPPSSSSIISDVSDVDQFNTPPGSPAVASGPVTAEELKRKLLERGGDEIFTYVENNSCIDNTRRIKLVNLTVDIMRNRHGNNPTPQHKSEFGEATIQLFPQLKDPFGKFGYSGQKETFGKFGYEAFYNPTNHLGYYAWRLRTINRNAEGKRKRNNEGFLKITKQKKLSSLFQASSDPVKVSPDDIQDKIIFLSNLVPKNDKELIFEKMRETFSYRRSLGIDILNKFPRFVDTPGLIEQDFDLLYPGKPRMEVAFNNSINKIFTIYKITESKLNTSIVPESVDGVGDVWDRATRAVLAVAQMLPPTAKGRGKGGKENVNHVPNKIIIFKKMELPLSEVNVQTTQPVLIAEGSTRATITQYNIYVDGKIIPLETDTTSIQAFERLLMAHFVFSCKYDSSIETFWIFMQTFFMKIDVQKSEDLYTAKMRERQI